MAPQPPEVSTTAISVALGNLTLNCSMMACSVGGAEIFCEIEMFLQLIPKIVEVCLVVEVAGTDADKLSKREFLQIAERK